MSKIVIRKLGFEASPSPDVSGYTLYSSLASLDRLGYTDPHVDVGIPLTDEVNGATVHLVVLNDWLGDLVDGEYDFGIAAYDGAGNEATIVETTMTIDITAPDPVPFLGDVS